MSAHCTLLRKLVVLLEPRPGNGVYSEGEHGKSMMVMVASGPLEPDSQNAVMQDDLIVNVHDSHEEENYFFMKVTMYFYCTA